jgi:hypothetical protein
LTIVKVNATVKRGGVAFSLTKRGVAFSLTSGKHGLFVGVEGIFKVNWATPPAGGVLRLVLQTFYPQEAVDATFERRRT